MKYTKKFSFGQSLKKILQKKYRALDLKPDICYIVRQEKQGKMDANYIFRIVSVLHKHDFISQPSNEKIMILKQYTNSYCLASIWEITL
jgi:hypothetical protein